MFSGRRRWAVMGLLAAGNLAPIWHALTRPPERA